MTFSGILGQPFRVLSTNSLGAPLANWPVLTNGFFGVGGSATISDPAMEQQRFYHIASP
jgi:hypothetical protein